jgi:hypothetical protein
MVAPERFAAMWQKCGGRKLGVVAQLAADHGCKARTVRHWMTQFGRLGMQGLVDKDRSDKGSHRKINRAARELILADAAPKRGVFGTLTVNEMYRAYMEERAWREGRIGKPLSGEDAEKYAKYLEDGRLSEARASRRFPVRPFALACRTSPKRFALWRAAAKKLLRSILRSGPLRYANFAHLVIIFCLIR